MEATIPGLEFDPVTSSFLIGFSIIMVGLLASSEAGILSVNKIRIKNLENNGDKKAKAVNELLLNHDKLFATILTTENAFIILASSVSATVADKLFPGGAGTLIASFVMTILIVIFGEITPKTFAAQNSEKVALGAAIPIKFLVKVLNYPIMFLTASTKFLLYLLYKMGFGNREFHDYSITEGEIRMMIDEGHLQQNEKDLLQNVFDFGDTVAEEVMTPRTMIKAIPSNYTVHETLLEMTTYGYSKLPVYENSIDTIVGIVTLKELIDSVLQDEKSNNEKIEKFIKPAVFIPESKKITDILKLMQQERIQLCIVTDEFGGTEGRITVQDLLEEIVGDIEEGQDGDSEDVETLDERTYVLNGAAYITDLSEDLGLNVPEGNYQTIAGFILHKLGKIPTPGEKFIHENLEIIVSEVMGPKILKVMIIKH